MKFNKFSTIAFSAILLSAFFCNCFKKEADTAAGSIFSKTGKLAATTDVRDNQTGEKVFFS